MGVISRILLFLIIISDIALAESRSILNVSYDPTRELYKEYNALFAAHWKKEKGAELNIKQSHGGSGKQARSVIDGLEADVVTLALAFDIDIIAEQTGAIDPDWQKEFPANSSPYTSTIVFLVRKGNPKAIKDWSDLVKDGVQVITPNPKTSGGARWNYLAAYGYALSNNGGDHEKAKEFVGKLFANVPVLDTGARGSTTTFVQRQIGDVLITWENEAYLALNEFGEGSVEIVVPSISIRAEPPVAIVDKTVDKRGTREEATAYIKFLYAEESQRLVAKHFYRPTNPKIFEEVKGSFPDVMMISIDEMFGGWKAAQETHFKDGGIFDRIYQVK